MKTKISVGFITYGTGTAKYLSDFLPSLKKALSLISSNQIFVIDNTEEENNGNSRYIKDKFPEITYEWSKENIGFARAYNKMINKARSIGSEYFLVINPDLILEETSIKKLIEILEEDESLGSVSPKIMKWDFENDKKTSIIDTCGIKYLNGLKFIDVGQGEIDIDQYKDQKILGPSGACGLFKMSAFEKIRTKQGKYFDEDMFMYKEDCDLAYRLFLFGYDSKLVSKAIVHHDRTVAKKGDGLFAMIRDRKSRSKNVRIWSFVNQQIIYYKYWHTLNYINKKALVINQVKLLLYILLFEQFLLLQLPVVYRFERKYRAILKNTSR